MAERKVIHKGNIGNALHSVAPDHITTTSYEVFDEERQEYQENINEGVGKYIEDQEFIAVWTGSNNCIIVGFTKDGKVYYGAGVPPQIIEYIESKLSALSLDEYEDIVSFLDDLEFDDKTLRELLNEKVDKEENKSLIDSDFADNVSYEQNVEFILVWLDNTSKIVFAVKPDGDFYFGAGVPKQIQDFVLSQKEEIVAVIETKVDKEDGKSLIQSDVADNINFEENPEFINVETDSKKQILGGRKPNGTKFENMPFETPSSLTETIKNKEWLKLLTDLKGRILKGITPKGIQYFDKTNIVSKKKVSIIGDSISTFDEEGYKLDGYRMYYPTGDVKHVEDTWWKQVIDNIDGVLEINASYSGSKATILKSYDTIDILNVGFSSRVPLLGNPDIIIVELGTNDSINLVDIDSTDFDASSYDLSIFSPAYIRGIKDIIKYYPNATIVCVSMYMLDGYAKTIEKIAKHYGAIYVDARSAATQIHPNKSQMAEISKIVSAEIKKGIVKDEIESLHKLEDKSVDLTHIGSVISKHDTEKLVQTPYAIYPGDGYLYCSYFESEVGFSEDPNPSVKVRLVKTPICNPSSDSRQFVQLMQCGDEVNCIGYDGTERLFKQSTSYAPYDTFLSMVDDTTIRFITVGCEDDGAVHPGWDEESHDSQLIGRDINKDTLVLGDTLYELSLTYVYNGTSVTIPMKRTELGIFADRRLGKPEGTSWWGRPVIGFIVKYNNYYYTYLGGMTYEHDAEGFCGSIIRSTDCIHWEEVSSPVQYYNDYGLTDIFECAIAIYDDIVYCTYRSRLRNQGVELAKHCALFAWYNLNTGQWCDNPIQMFPWYYDGSRNYNYLRREYEAKYKYNSIKNIIEKQEVEKYYLYVFTDVGPIIHTLAGAAIRTHLAMTKYDLSTPDNPTQIYVKHFYSLFGFTYNVILRAGAGEYLVCAENRRFDYRSQSGGGLPEYPCTDIVCKPLQIFEPMFYLI